MADAPRKPGMLQDPWRTNAPTPAAKPVPKRKVTSAAPTEDEYGNDLEKKFSTIDLKGYGAITITGTSEETGAGGRLLDFALANKREIEPIFTQYGIVLAQLATPPVNLRFYVHREDGWLLAIPEVTTRDAGCLQLIQAFLHIKTIPALKKKLEDAKISVYKF